jgi:hypothetical protein
MSGTFESAATEIEARLKNTAAIEGIESNGAVSIGWLAPREHRMRRADFHLYLIAQQSMGPALALAAIRVAAPVTNFVSLEMGDLIKTP